MVGSDTYIPRGRFKLDVRQIEGGKKASGSMDFRKRVNLKTCEGVTESWILTVALPEVGEGVKSMGEEGMQPEPGGRQGATNVAASPAKSAISSELQRRGNEQMPILLTV